MKKVSNNKFARSLYAIAIMLLAGTLSVFGRFFRNEDSTGHLAKNSDKDQVGEGNHKISAAVESLLFNRASADTAGNYDPPDKSGCGCSSG